MKKVFILIFSLLFIVSCSRSQVVFDVEHTQAPQGMTLKEVGNGVVMGIMNNTAWKIISHKEGIVVARVLVRSHAAQVEIWYDEAGYSIKYVTSQNLNYSESNGEKVIHRNYNKWIITLDRNIQKSLYEQVSN